MPRFNLDQYDDVNSRISKFWEEYPDGRILPSLASDPNNLEEVVFKAEVYTTREDERPVSVGWAFEKRGKSVNDGANLTHHLENAETSAIGRALANLNFKTNKNAPRPSRQEMEKIDRASPAPVRQPTVRTTPPDSLVHAQRPARPQEIAQTAVAPISENPTASRWIAGINKKFWKPINLQNQIGCILSPQHFGELSADELEKLNIFMDEAEGAVTA